ncbi:MAG: AAA family ATPase, partial [Ignavibacteria bacterium]|nr:AAA family ATPase [Ignavibacteria bacterium]
MIERLYIKNYLIIKEAEIELDRGLNILTGETGAGKSIILDALALILGERADYSKIKKDEDRLIVEGHFNFAENKTVQKIINDIFPDEESGNDNIILR